MLLPVGTNIFPPLSSNVDRNLDLGRVGPSRTAHVKSIASVGRGFMVTYVVDGQERLVAFPAASFDADLFLFMPDSASGTNYLFSFTDSFRRNGDSRNEGSSEFEYFDVLGTEYALPDRPLGRSHFVFGARTGVLPRGTARYVGRMRAELWDNNENIRSSGALTLLWGGFGLTADFGSGTIAGSMSGLSARGRDDAGTRRWPVSTYFEIANGRIVDGQFAGELEGIDTASGSPLDRSVRGFDGNVLGEFYGPSANEVGLVFNAVRDTDDKVILGWAGGRQALPMPERDMAPFSAGIEERYPATAGVALSDDDSIEAVGSDDAGGFRVTYTIDGTPTEVELPASGFNSWKACAGCYHTRDGDRSYALFEAARSFRDNPEFDHFSVAGWIVVDWSSSDESEVEDVFRGYVVYGTPTPVSGLPGSGTATYSGRMFASSRPVGAPGSANAKSLRGDLTLTADFDADTVGGSIASLQYREQGGAYGTNDMLGTRLDLAGGTIAGNRFSADLSSDVAGAFTGTMDGGFYGPAAAEVGGVLSGTAHNLDEVVHGYFGGTKE